MKVRQTLSDVVNRVNSHPKQSRAKTRRRASALSTGRQLQNGPHNGTNHARGSKPYFKTSASCCSRTNCVGISIWIGSLVFLTCGLVQFIAGAYFLTTLHVFHLGSNIWTGIWAVICALLSVYLYGSFTATSNDPQSHLEPNTRPKRCRLSRRSRYYVITGLAISMLLVNLVNLIVMEVLERPAAEHRKARDYSESVFQTVRLACTGMTGTAIVTGIAMAMIVYFTSLRNSDKRNITTLTELPTKRRNQQRSGDWVFRMEDITSMEPKASSVSYSNERTATIRRAPSLLLTFSESSGLKTHLRNDNRRNSLRMQGSRKLTRANVQRSQTMREFLQTSSAPSFTTTVRSVNFSSSTCDVRSGKKDGRYVRLSSKFDSLDSELAFVADNIESKTVTFTPSTSHSTLTTNNSTNTSTDTGISSRPSSLTDQTTSPSVTPESINPTLNPKQAPERIILRVESMKVPYHDKVMEAKWSRVRQCERTSSSTQTELSSLAEKSGIRHRPVVTSAIKKRPAPTRPITPPPTHIAYSTPTLALPVGSEPLPSLDFTEGTRSPTDSSSGYSSPNEENRSKVSTPEPAKSTKDTDKELMQASTPALPPLPAEVVHEPDGVTVIKIDTTHDSPWLADSHQTYDIPRKLYATPVSHSTRYGRDNTMPLLPRSPRLNVHHLTRESKEQSPDFQVHIRTNPAISRSVSFQHQRDNWRVKYNQGSKLAEVHHSASERLRELPEEEFEHRPVSRKLGRSSSVSVAMAEIERRLEYLRMHTKGNSYTNSHAHSSEQSSLGTEFSSLATTACTTQDYDPNRLEGQDLAGIIDHTETLAYLSELELLARHWRSQLLYRQLDLKTKSQQFVRLGMQEAFEC